MSKAIKKKEETGMAFASERPSFIKESDRGQENVSMDDVTIPRLDVLQDLSPQRKRNDPAYIEGAEEGMLYNTVTNLLYGTDVYFVPCFYKKEWLIWKLQDAGGGLNGVYDTEAEAKAAFKEEGLDEIFHEKGKEKVCSYEIVDTANHFGLVFSGEDDIQEICLSMSKSKMKVNRQFNTIIKMAGGDRFSRVYRVSSFEDTNKANQKYYNLKIAPMGYVSEAMYHLGEKLYEAISNSEKKVVHEVPKAAAGKPEGDEPQEY